MVRDPNWARKMRMIERNLLSYESRRSKSGLGVKYSKNSFLNYKSLQYAGYSPLCISGSNGMRHQTCAKDAQDCEKSFELCLELAPTRTDDKIANLPTQRMKIANISKCVGEIKILNKNSKLSFNFASEDI